MTKVLTIGIPTERAKNEKRVALTPNDVHALTAKEGIHVLIEKGAGASAGFPDGDYLQNERVKKATATQAWGADLVLHVQPPSLAEIKKMKRGSVLISHIFPETNATCVRALAKASINCLAMELLPRITRAQAVDSLSSQATISGYWSVLHAASCAPFFFPMITYAAGTIRPAKLLVIGAGVAGLQAIATAKRLGAIVEGYDVRPETREQIASLGAKPIDLGFDASGEGGYARELTDEEKQLASEILAKHVSKSDVVICTAGLPGKPAPKILFKSHVESMKTGSLILDMVADSGGNCALTKAGENKQHKGVTIIGPNNIPSKIPLHASQMYSRNLMGMVALLIQHQQLVLDTDDAIVQGSLLVRSGEVTHAQWREHFTIPSKAVATRGKQTKIKASAKVAQSTKADTKKMKQTSPKNSLVTKSTSTKSTSKNKASIATPLKENNTTTKTPRKSPKSATKVTKKATKVPEKEKTSNRRSKKRPVMKPIVMDSTDNDARQSSTS